MEHTYRCLLAIGSEEIETQIIELPEVHVIDSDPDIDIIADILNYETVDFVILNTILSQEKSLELAKKAREKSVKVIAFVESYKNKELIAALVGYGVNAVLLLDEVKQVKTFISNYPEKYDFNQFQEDVSGNFRNRQAGIKGKLFGSLLKSSSPAMAAPGRRNCEIIGVIGTSRGAGATSFCIYYSAHLKEMKKRCLLLDRTENGHLKDIEIKGQDISGDALTRVNLKKYDYILVDFGCLAEVAADGKITLGPDMTNEKRIERNSCHEIILVAPSLPWRLFELSAYIRNGIFQNLSEEWIFYINGEENDLFKDIKRLYEKERQFFVPAAHDEPYSALDELLEARRLI